MNNMSGRGMGIDPCPLFPVAVISARISPSVLWAYSGRRWEHQLSSLVIKALSIWNLVHQLQMLLKAIFLKDCRGYGKLHLSALKAKASRTYNYAANVKVKVIF